MNMSYKNELLYQMAENLNIDKFACEDDSGHINRILYSAIVNWIVTSANDVVFEENYNRKGVSKSYITRRISNVVEEYLGLYPEFGKYLQGAEPNETVSKMRELIEEAGFLTATGFDEFISLPPLKEMKVTNDLYLVKGLCKASGVLAIGLGLYTHNSVTKNSTSMKEMFYIPKIDAVTWTKEYIKSIQWKNSSSLNDDVQFFNSKTQKTFANSWIDRFPKAVEVTIYKKHDRDYGFAQKCGDTVRGIQIPDHLIGVESVKTDNLFNNDVRRFMYGLKSIHNNKASSKLTIEKDVGVLQLFNALPEREIIALRFMGWPTKNISDNFSFYIPLRLLPTVKEILLNLNIAVEEINNG